MEDEVIVAPEAPVVETPKAPEASESLIEKRRAEIEKAVIAENEVRFDPPVEDEAPKVETPKEEPKVEDDPLDRIKKSVQKRIDKVVAQKKSAEEELAEARLEIERLKASKTPEKQEAPKDDMPPTPEQVEAYIAKMSEEGNHKEVAAATRYLIKLEKELAIKEIEERQNKVQTQEQAKKVKVDADMKSLASDYVVYNDKGEPDAVNDLTLSNQKGLLFRTALSLYNDKDLHKDFYNDPDVVSGFRRAVADAYREIHQQGLVSPKTEKVVVPRTPRESLAVPDAETPEESPNPKSNELSDREKVMEEIKQRKKNLFLRPIS